MTNALVKVRKNQNECGSRVKKQVLPTYLFLLLSINCCSYRFMLSCNENPWLMQFADIYDIGVRRYVINNSSVINMNTFVVYIESRSNLCFRFSYENWGKKSEIVLKTR